MANEQSKEQVVAELTQLKEARERIEDREKELKARLRELGEGEHKIGDNKVRITPNRRLSNEKVERAFPPGQFPLYYRTVPESAVLKAKIGEDEYRELMDEVGEARVTIL